MKIINRWASALLLTVLMLFILAWPVLAAPYRVYIDPGHGGLDSGAIGPAETLEKDVNLAVALKTAKILKQYQELAVYMTRASDDVSWSQATTAKDLQGRCDLANALPADYFVSIHCDSYSNPAAKGTTAYCYKFGGDGELLARNIHARMLNVPGIEDGSVLAANDILASLYGINYTDLTLPDHGIKEGNFQVLRNTWMPAALIEMSFISNPQEEALLNSSTFQDQAAQAIALGILDYIGIDPIKSLYMGKPTLNIDGTSYVPLNAFLRTLGTGNVVKWDPVKEMITFDCGDKTYQVQIGRDELQEV